MKRHKMISKWLAVLIIFKNVSCLNQRWDEPSPAFEKNGEKLKTARLKSTKSSMSYPSVLIKDITESIFPEVIYPTSILDAREPFYFRSSGYDDVLSPFSDDVKTSYKALKEGQEKQSTFTNYLPSLNSAENTKTIFAKNSIDNQNSMNNNMSFNYSDETYKIDSDKNKSLSEKYTISYILCLNSSEESYANCTGVVGDYCNKDITAIVPENITADTTLHFQLPTNSDTQDNYTNEAGLNTSRLTDNIKPNWDESDVSVNSVTSNLSYVNKFTDYYNKEFISEEAKSNSSHSQPHVLRLYDQNKLDDEKYQNDSSLPVKYCNNNETDSEISGKLCYTKNVFETILNSLENLQESVKSLPITPNDKYIKQKIASDEFRTAEDCLCNTTRDNKYLQKLNDTENTSSNLATDSLLTTVTTTDGGNFTMVKVEKISSDLSLVDMKVDSDIIQQGLNLKVSKDEGETENVCTKIIDCLPQFLTELFANHFLKVDAKSRLAMVNKSMEKITSTSYEYHDDIPVNTSDYSNDKSYDHDKILSDDTEFTIESLEIINDNSDESNVKSAASTLSNFDTFKYGKNPFSVFFNFPRHDA